MTSEYSRFGTIQATPRHEENAVKPLGLGALHHSQSRSLQAENAVKGTGFSAAMPLEVTIIIERGGNEARDLR